MSPQAQGATAPGKVRNQDFDTGGYSATYFVADLRTSQDVPRSIPVSSNVQRLFHQLAQQWKTETLLSSSLAEICMHEAYQKIIGLGPRAVPLILADLEQEPNHWYWALAAITRADPAANAPDGDIEAVCQAWKDWGRHTGARFAYAGLVS